MVKIEINGLDGLLNNLNQYGEKVKQDVANATMDAALNIIAKAKQNLATNKSVITGSLVKSLRIEGSGLKLSVGTNIEYAPDVEYGTAAHEITPKNGNCLVFEINGKPVFVKRVHHPGNKAKPFFNPAVEETRPFYKEQLKEALNAGH